MVSTASHLNRMRKTMIIRNYKEITFWLLSLHERESRLLEQDAFAEIFINCFWNVHFRISYFTNSPITRPRDSHCTDLLSTQSFLLWRVQSLIGSEHYQFKQSLSHHWPPPVPTLHYTIHKTPSSSFLNWCCNHRQTRSIIGWRFPNRRFSRALLNFSAAGNWGKMRGRNIG